MLKRLATTMTTNMPTLSFINSPFTTKAAFATWSQLPDAAKAAALPARRIPLPALFDVVPGTAVCEVVPAASGRTFGRFAEKTLACNREAKIAIDRVCRSGGFTQSWERQPGPDGLLKMKKIPVVILIKLMLGLPKADEDLAELLTGAYSICMMPDSQTCMNVIVGRHPAGSGFAVDKFSLYYPNNEIMYQKHGNDWPLLQGYSFRTAVLNGVLNRAALDDLRRNSLKAAPGTTFDGDSHGLVIDGASEYEDCAYMSAKEGEADSDRAQRIEGMVRSMVSAYGNSTLALSYDPAERDAGVTALQSEWDLLKKQLEL